jgi:hypothetical protein
MISRESNQARKVGDGETANAGCNIASLWPLPNPSFQRTLRDEAAHRR